MEQEFIALSYRQILGLLSSDEAEEYAALSEAVQQLALRTSGPENEIPIEELGDESRRLLDRHTELENIAYGRL